MNGNLIFCIYLMKNEEFRKQMHLWQDKTIEENLKQLQSYYTTYIMSIINQEKNGNNC